MPVRKPTRGRQGFTLVELLVAAALCVIIMSVLATVFQISIDTMRQLRSTTDMADQLRAATEVIRLDLQNDHFVAGASSFNQSTKLSGQQVDATGWVPPAGGFFRILSNNGTQEGSDGLGLFSFRADGTVGNLLHFTSIAPTGLDRDLYTAPITSPTTGNPINSQAAEIAYFLVAMPGGPTTGGPSPVSLFTLIRRQRLVALNPTVATQFNLAVASSPTLAPGFISLNATTGQTNTLADVINPANRLGGANATGTPATPLNPNASGSLAADAQMGPLSSTPGDDFLLSNVISLDVRVLWTAVSASAVLPQSFANTTTGVIINSESPFDALSNAGTAEFDTRLGSTTNLPPNQIRVRSIQVRIRIWDPKVQNARQATITQAL